MSAGNVFSAIVVGLLIGALGRLVVPGRQPIGCLMTLLMGIIGAVAGAALGRQADAAGWLVFVLQVGVAAVGVAVVAAAMHGPRRRPPSLR
jgi:uncharacterized membrane protein YeaQ/YmgE (transglycosylase-associated protein family)